MSHPEADFDTTVTAAADCLVDAYGLEGAIAELQERRRDGVDTGRVNEALAYLKREAGDV